MDDRHDPGAGNRGKRPGPIGAEVTGSGAGAGGGGSPEDYDSDPQGGDKTGSPKSPKTTVKKENDLASG